MNNTKLKLVPLGSSDIITSSIPTVSGVLTLANFGNGTLKDATVTGYFAGKNIDFSGNTSSSAFTDFLEGVYGDNYRNVKGYFDDTRFQYGSGRTDAFSNLSLAFDTELEEDDEDYPYNMYNGTYTFDSLSNKFIKQLTE